MLNKYVNYKVFLTVAGVLVALNLLSLGVIWFQKPPKPDERHRGPAENINFFMEELGWSDQQQKKFEGPERIFAKEHQALIDSIKQARKELFAETTKIPFSQAGADSLSESIGLMQVRIEKLRSRHFSFIASICTPEELRKFDRLLQDVFTMKRTPENMEDGPGRK